MRTFDNRLVRFNGCGGCSSSTSRFPIRRLDLPVRVAFKEDPARVMALLREIAAANPLCLDNPAPIVIFNGFGDSGMNFTLGVWFSSPDMLAVRASILCGIKACLDREGIEIPVPHIVHTRATLILPGGCQTPPATATPATAERLP